MGKIRVAFFAEILIADFDGASRTMFQLFDRIDSDQFEFLFICANGPAQVAGFECFKVPSLGIPLNSKYSLGLPALKSRLVRNRLDEFAPDVVHIATPSLLGHFGINYAGERGIPVISIYHTHFISYIDYYFSYLPFLVKPVKNLVRNVQNSFYNRCDKVYIPAASIAEELINAGMRADNIKIWERGIDTALFSASKRNENYMRQLTGNDLPSVLFVSRLVWEKNLETLIGVYNLLKKESFPCNFIVAGDGVARADCEEKMPGAIFPGQLGHEELSVLYASASVFVFPSVSETFGNVVLEAMASGLVPVIADGGGSRDFIANGENGYKCAPYEAAAYVEKIKAALEDTSLRNTLSANAIAFSKSYDWDALAQIYFNDLAGLALPIEKIKLED